MQTPSLKEIAHNIGAKIMPEHIEPSLKRRDHNGNNTISSLSFRTTHSSLHTLDFPQEFTHATDLDTFAFLTIQRRNKALKTLLDAAFFDFCAQ
jgi:hypothetical protein